MTTLWAVNEFHIPTTVAVSDKFRFVIGLTTKFGATSITLHLRLVPPFKILIIFLPRLRLAALWADNIVCGYTGLRVLKSIVRFGLSLISFFITQLRTNNFHMYIVCVFLFLKFQSFTNLSPSW